MKCMLFSVLHNYSWRPLFLWIPSPWLLTSSIFFVFQLLHAIGSIEAIAKASKKHILENTDLSAEKAETIESFFRDPKYYLSAKISWSDKCIPFSLIRERTHILVTNYISYFLTSTEHAFQAPGTTILRKMITSLADVFVYWLSFPHLFQTSLTLVATCSWLIISHDAPFLLLFSNVLLPGTWGWPRIIVI